ncbi:hypothetical protein [Streptomyces sp. NPDC088254]|uniref:hypothetical protein n=1 Tax=Streptomyces sp. NPDC088254 TaxID=3365847 RepID=UPI0038273150
MDEPGEHVLLHPSRSVTGCPAVRSTRHCVASACIPSFGLSHDVGCKTPTARAITGGHLICAMPKAVPKPCPGEVYE